MAGSMRCSWAMLEPFWIGCVPLYGEHSNFASVIGLNFARGLPDECSSPKCSLWMYWTSQWSYQSAASTCCRIVEEQRSQTKWPTYISRWDRHSCHPSSAFKDIGTQNWWHCVMVEHLQWSTRGINVPGDRASNHCPYLCQLQGADNEVGLLDDICDCHRQVAVHCGARGWPILVTLQLQNDKGMWTTEQTKTANVKGHKHSNWKKLTVIVNKSTVLDCCISSNEECKSWHLHSCFPQTVYRWRWLPGFA